jgi:hypothetical protein
MRSSRDWVRHERVKRMVVDFAGMAGKRVRAEGSLGAF